MKTTSNKKWSNVGGDDVGDLMNYVNIHFNWSGNPEEDLAFISATGIDPLQWLISTNHSFFNLTRVPFNASGDSGMPSIWQEGKVRILLYSIIFLLGIAGNGLVILTILQNSRLRTVTNLFLLNLAISDLLLGVFCIPFTLVGALLRDFVFGEVFCKLIPFLQAVSVSVSGWTLVAISIERFYAICHPFTSMKWQTRSHARQIILVVWMGSLAVMSPVAILSELKPVGRNGRRKCRELWPDETLEKAFTVVLDVILLVVPLLLMVVMYSMIVNHLWKANQSDDTNEETTPGSRKRSFRSSGNLQANGRGHQDGSTGDGVLMVHQPLTICRPDNDQPPTSLPINNGGESRISPSIAPNPSSPTLRRCNPEQGLKTKRRVLKMLIVVVLEFFVCWTPLYVVNTLSLFAPKALYGGLGYTGISLLQLLAQASCCCNPITYCFMSSSFRRAFVEAFGCARHITTRPRTGVM